MTDRAEQMREAAASLCETFATRLANKGNAECDETASVLGVTAHEIRALPLPPEPERTAEEEEVRLGLGILDVLTKLDCTVIGIVPSQHERASAFYAGEIIRASLSCRRRSPLIRRRAPRRSGWRCWSRRRRWPGDGKNGRVTRRRSASGLSLRDDL